MRILEFPKTIVNFRYTVHRFFPPLYFVENAGPDLLNSFLYLILGNLPHKRAACLFSTLTLHTVWCLVPVRLSALPASVLRMFYLTP